MKKTLLLLVALITATIAFAKTEINGIYYNLNDETKTAEVTYQYQYYWDEENNYSGVTSITIPEKITYNATEYSVTSIGSSAFSYCSSLTSISIPNSVTSIGSFAFISCESLTSITIPNSVTSIGNNAFNNCDALTSITIPNSVTSIGDFAFSNCSRLTSISIPNNVTSIGNSAFYDCDALTSITIPNSVTSIGNAAFSRCSSLTSITIEATTPPTLGTSVFEGTNLVAIYIPDNTLYAYKEAWGTDYIFVNNENTLIIHVETPGTLSDKIFDAEQRPAFVTKLTVTGTLNDDDFTCMRETMTSLIDIDLSGIINTTGVNFYGKNNLIKILLPENLTSIGDEAFFECSSLTSITIPNSVTSIGNSAFSSCYSLTSITIPNTVTSIGYSAFQSCSSLTSITIPNSVTSIGSSAFQSCSSLTSITIPNSVTSIEDYAFDCDALTSITCLGSTPPEASDLSANTSTCTLIVPKEAYSSYLRHAYWGHFLTIRTIGEKEIKTAVNNSAWGKVTGAGIYNENDEATLTATANSGYRFVKWSDEVTDNPRTVVVTQDSTFTAIFEANSFAITTAVNDDAMGSVTEGGEYTYGTEITLTATPNDGYRFAQWSDGNTDNPRIITVTENKTYTAEFEVAEATNVETSKISSANIYTTNGTLHIEGATENYHILDAAGRLIYTGNTTTLQLPRGIYLVTMGGEVEKIVL